MSWLYITEVEKIGFTLVDGQVLAAPKLPGVKAYRIPITGGSTPSGRFDNRTRYVLMNCDDTCSLAWAGRDDATPNAVQTADRMGQNETRFIGVDPGGELAVTLNT